LLQIPLRIGNAHILIPYRFSDCYALFNCIINTFSMSKSSIPSREASQLPSPTETTIVTATNSATATDPGDYSSVFKALRALQLANLPLRRITRVSALKRTYTQAKLSHGGVY